MKWEDVEKIIMSRFPREDVEPDPGTRLSETKRLTSEHIAEWLFRLVKKTSKEAWVCEIGTLYGFLTAAMGLACLESERRLFTIDHMIGSHCMDMRIRAKCIYLDFVDNMIELGVWDKIVPFPMKSFSPLDLSIYENENIIPKSVRDAQYFQASDMLSLMEAEFELIYIDGNHTYENVIQELKIYSKFLKPGGIICGDDCHAYGMPFLNSFVHNKNNFEKLPARAVAMAMLEFFSGNDEFEPVAAPINQFCFRRLK